MTVIFYHALTSVLGNDKRLTVELPCETLELGEVRELKEKCRGEPPGEWSPLKR